MYVRGRKARKKKTAVGPQGLPIQSSSSQKRAAKKSRPAPAVQPGPIRQTERDTAERFKKTGTYRESVRQARKAQPLKTRQARVQAAESRSTKTVEDKVILKQHREEIARNAVLKAGRATQTGMSDQERKRVARYTQTPEFRKTIAAVARSRDEQGAKKYEKQTDREYERQFRSEMAGPRFLPNTRPGEKSSQAGKPVKIQAATKDTGTVALDKAVQKVAAQAAASGADPKQVRAGIMRAADKHKAPALQLLEQTQRPVRAISGAAEKVLEGRPQDAPKAVARGLVKNKGPGFQKVLKKAGAPAPVAAIGGFALDVASDPTTYISFGTVGVARSAAVTAAESAAKAAARKGLSKSAQEAMARAAYRQAIKKAGGKAPRVATKVSGKGGSARQIARRIDNQHPVVDGARGVRMSFAGRDVKSVAKTTARVPKAARAVRRRLDMGGGGVRVLGAEGARDVARQVRPQVRAAGVSREEHDLLRAAMRSGRAARAQASSEGDRQAQAIIRQLEADPDRYARVIDAIERGRIGKLPEADREVAVALRSFNRGRARKLRSEGVAMGDVRKGDTLRTSPARTPDGRMLPARTSQGRAQDYIRHQTAVEPAPSGPLGRKARKRAQTQSIQIERTDPRPISVQNKTGKTPLSTDLPTLQGVAVSQGGRALETARVGRAILDVGRPVTKAPAADETVVRVAGGKIERVSGDDIDRLLSADRKNPPQPGQYRTVKTSLLNDVEERMSAGADTPGQLLKVPSKITGAFKKVVYFSPAFQGRNAIGDLLLAYGETSPREIAKGAATGARVLKHVSKTERAQGRKIAARVADNRTVKVGGETMTLDEFAQELMDGGVIRMNRSFEFDEMLRGGRVEPKTGGHATQAVREKTKGASVRRWLENREDLMRISTYKALRDRGVSKVDAQNMVANVHIDYSELSKAERGIRATVAPFYTFNARQVPELSKRIVTRPGKAANFEKARQNTAQATGGNQDNLNESEQRSVPFVIGLPGGDNRVIQFGAPQTLLNETPQIQALGGNIADAMVGQGSEWLKFGVSQLAPLWRVPIELQTGSSSFFRSELEPKDNVLKPAPSWALDLPAEWQRLLKVTDRYYDRKTGKRVPGWRGNAQYLLSQIPGLPALVNKQMTPGQDTSKQTQAEKLLGLSGVQSRTSRTLENAMGRLFDRHEQLDRSKSMLEDQISPGTRRKIKGTEVEERKRVARGLRDPVERRIVEETMRLQDRIGQVETQIAAVSQSLGYGSPYFADKLTKKKARKRKADPWGTGGTGAGWGGSTKAPGF